MYGRLSIVKTHHPFERKICRRNLLKEHNFRGRRSLKSIITHLFLNPLTRINTGRDLTLACYPVNYCSAKFLLRGFTVSDPIDG